jgi:hypothetical protein
VTSEACLKPSLSCSSGSPIRHEALNEDGVFFQSQAVVPNTGQVVFAILKSLQRTVQDENAGSVSREWISSMRSCISMEWISPLVEAFVPFFHRRDSERILARD